MATVVRAALYVPRPPEESYWGAVSQGSPLLARLLTSVKIFGAGGQGPTKAWPYTHDSGESFWLGRPTGRNLNVLIAAATATPFVNPAWKFGFAEETGWQGEPYASPALQLLTAIKMYGAGGQAPTKRQRFDHDSGESFWQFEVPYNLALVSTLQFPVARESAWNSPDDPPPWQPVFSRNLNLLTAAVAATPFVNPAWKFGFAEETGWQGEPNASPALQLLTAIKMYGAGGQAPTKRQRFDYDSGESFWQGRPTPSALLAPLLTASGQVVARPWRFGLDDAPAWQPTSGRNINLLNSAAPPTPFVGQPWRFAGTEEAGWQGQPSRSAPISLLTAVKLFGAGGQAPPAPWDFNIDDAPSWRPPAGRNLNLLAAVAAVTPFTGAAWRSGEAEGAPWQAMQGRNLLLFFPRPTVPDPRYILGFGKRPIRKLP